MVNSLTNGPNGGEPVMARKPARNSAPGQRHALDGPAHVVGDLAAVGPVDVAGREEQHALGQAVVDQVQQRPVHGQAADADAQDQDAHVLDAGVGQHPLEVALPDHEHRGDGHRQQAHEDHDLAGELGFGAGAADLVDAQDRQEGAAGDAAGQQRAHHARRLAVGVRLPGVHRGQAHLGAVADEQQHERRVQPGRRQLGGDLRPAGRRAASIPGRPSATQ